MRKPFAMGLVSGIALIIAAAWTLVQIGFTQAPLRESIDVTASTITTDCELATDFGISSNLATIPYGQVVAGGSPIDKSFAVLNSSAKQCLVSDIAVDGDAAFTVAGTPTFPFTMAPNTSFSFVVRFTPPSTAASFAATVRLVP